MRPAIGSGIVTGDALVSYWPNFPLHLESPSVFAQKITRPIFLIFFSSCLSFFG